LFDKNTYLERIGYSGSAEPTLATLQELHRKHQTKFHYDNAYVGITDFLQFDLDDMFVTTVLKGRGGICTDLNFLFHRLLEELGFDVKLVAAGILFPGGEWGPDVEHAVMVVHLDGEDWLTDVGYGGVSIVEPLRMSGETATQDGIDFRLLHDGDHHVLQYRTRGKDWRIAYRVTTKARDRNEWNVLTELNTIHKDVLVRRRRCVTDNGQVMLTANLIVSIEDGVERSRLVRDPAELEKVVSEYWG